MNFAFKGIFLLGEKSPAAEVEICYAVKVQEKRML